MPTYNDYQTEIVATGAKMYSKGFVAATDGNLSVRLDKNRILTTPSGVSKGFLEEKDLIVVDMSGRKLAGNSDPSSELRMHLRIYELRPDVCAVVHAHPPIATALTIAGISLEEPVIPEVVITMGKIPLAPYATPTTQEVPDSLKDLILSHDAILLERHGAVTVGKSLESAYCKLEKLEHCAQIIALAHQLGSVRPLSSSQIDSLLAVRQKYLGK